MKYILFTGITGQLGTAIVEHLVSKELPIACFIRKPEKEYPIDLSRFKVLVADISDRKSLFKYKNILKGQVHTIVHMASLGHGSTKDELHKVILEGSIHLYDFAEEIGCSNYLYFSSILAAGWSPGGKKALKEEDTPSLKHLCLFGKMKYQAEKTLLQQSKQRNTKIIIIRPGNIYGPPKLSFIEFVVNILKIRNKVFYHRAKNSVMWAPIYIQDVIDCIFMLTGQKSFNNNIYFLTGAEVVTMKYITEIVSRAINLTEDEINLNYFEKILLLFWKGYDFLRSSLNRPPFPNYIYSNSKIVNDFGFTPKMRLKEGISFTVKWALKNGKL